MSKEAVEQAWADYGEVQWVYYRDGVGDGVDSSNPEKMAQVADWLAREEVARAAVEAAIREDAVREWREAVEAALDAVYPVGHYSEPEGLVSCPKSVTYPAPIDGAVCDCGADDQNAALEPLRSLLDREKEG